MTTITRKATRQARNSRQCPEKETIKKETSSQLDNGTATRQARNRRECPEKETFIRSWIRFLPPAALFFTTLLFSALPNVLYVIYSPFNEKYRSAEGLRKHP